ncbi:MAG: hypothetical protein IIT84_03870 [Oscillospiraceae bacterium]|nr:hypothetical protein [Oscillospiraceae bacterium]
MRRFRSIYVKNLMIVALALALSFILLISAFAMISYSYVIREKTGDMEAYAKTSVNIISSYSGHFEADSLEMRGLLVLIAETGDYHVIVTDEVGNVISCSDRELECEHIGKTVLSLSCYFTDNEPSIRAGLIFLKLSFSFNAIILMTLG